MFCRPCPLERSPSPVRSGGVANCIMGELHNFRTGSAARAGGQHQSRDRRDEEEQFSRHLRLCAVQHGASTRDLVASTAQHTMPSPTSASSSLPGCNIYWHEEVLNRTFGKSITPADWLHTSAVAQELWMQRAMEPATRNASRNIEAADIVVLAANFSLLCPPTGRTYVYTLFDVWDHLLKHAPPLLLQAINGSVARPRVSIYLESSTCPNPWKYAAAETRRRV